MGYTHYWHQPTRMKAATFRTAVDDCKRVIAVLVGDGLVLQEEYDQAEPTPPVLDAKTVFFNGRGEDGHETFVIPRHFKPHSPHQTKYAQGWFGFCKTARKPYDIAVCACLIVFHHHFGTDFPVSSDGGNGEENWPKAREVCQAVLGYGSDFTLLDSDVQPVGIGGLTYEKLSDGSYRGYRTHYRLGNGWDMAKHDRPLYHWEPHGQKVRVTTERWDDEARCRKDVQICQAATIKVAVWKATCIHLMEEAKKRGHDVAAYGARAMETVGDWDTWLVAADFVQEHGGGNALRQFLPRSLTNAVAV